MSEKINGSSRTQSPVRENKSRHPKVRQVRGRINNSMNPMGATLEERAAVLVFSCIGGLFAVCISYLCAKKA